MKSYGTVVGLWHRNYEDDYDVTSKLRGLSRRNGKRKSYFAMVTLSRSSLYPVSTERVNSSVVAEEKEEEPMQRAGVQTFREKGPNAVYFISNDNRNFVHSSVNSQPNFQGQLKGLFSSIYAEQSGTHNFRVQGTTSVARTYGLSELQMPSKSLFADASTERDDDNALTITDFSPYSYIHVI
ncbi:hypothetical protein M0804_009870 [Polistes exclamans]|nr:hypothetical protein M0804_009870 [Polistes exclamans]